jgi:hypothetical protein
MEIAGFVAAVVVLYVAAALAAVYGVDSRDGNDWLNH